MSIVEAEGSSDGVASGDASPPGDKAPGRSRSSEPLAASPPCSTGSSDDCSNPSLSSPWPPTKVAWFETMRKWCASDKVTRAKTSTKPKCRTVLTNQLGTCCQTLDRSASSSEPTGSAGSPEREAGSGGGEASPPGGETMPAWRLSGLDGEPPMGFCCSGTGRAPPTSYSSRCGQGQCQSDPPGRSPSAHTPSGLAAQGGERGWKAS